jgi:methionine sulfoxide reductase heme-binding subunit
MPAKRKYPWLDRSGRLSIFKLAVFLSLFAPGAWTLLSYELGALGPRPLIEAIHQTGLWAIRFLMISLAITPLRRALHWPRLILTRRMVGVAAFSYATLHLALYVADQAFDWRLVASEIVFRFYLTIGFLTLMSLSVLAATSTDGMIRRLGGRRWRRLHQSVYVIAILALVHYFIQSKLNVTEPLVVAGLFSWLMANRAIFWIWGEDSHSSFWSLISLSVIAGLLTATGEAAYYRLVNGFDLWRVLAANIGWYFDRRPGWIVLVICLALTTASLFRAGYWPRSRQSQTANRAIAHEPAR